MTPGYIGHGKVPDQELFRSKGILEHLVQFLVQDVRGQCHIWS